MGDKRVYLKGTLPSAYATPYRRAPSHSRSSATSSPPPPPRCPPSPPPASPNVVKNQSSPPPPPSSTSPEAQDAEKREPRALPPRPPPPRLPHAWRSPRAHGTHGNPSAVTGKRLRPPPAISHAGESSLLCNGGEDFLLPV